MVTEIVVPLASFRTRQPWEKVDYLTPCRLKIMWARYERPVTPGLAQAPLPMFDRWPLRLKRADYH